MERSGDTVYPSLHTERVPLGYADHWVSFVQDVMAIFHSTPITHEVPIHKESEDRGTLSDLADGPHYRVKESFTTVISIPPSSWDPISAFKPELTAKSMAREDQQIQNFLVSDQNRFELLALADWAAGFWLTARGVLGQYSYTLVLSLMHN